MASTYSSDLKLELMATGENAGTWGTKTNTNLELVQQAIAGYQEINVASSDVTLDMNNGSISNARNMVLKFTGTLTGTRVVTLPNSIEKFYVVIDGTTHSGNSLTFKTASGTGFTCVQGKSHFAYSDGTNLNLISGIQLANNTLDAVLDNGNSSDGTINVSNITVTAATTTNTIVASSTIAAGGTISNSSGDINSSAGNVSDQKGEMRLVPVESKSTNYTLQASDHGKVISISAGDITVPSGVFSAGQTVTIFSNRSSGVIDINRSGVTMYWATDGSNANRDLEPRGVATILCVASNTFVITGGTLS
jgi:hypothetical protein